MFAAQAIAPPHVILVSSHADVVKSRGEDVHEKMESISKVIQHLSSTFHFAGQIALDCRDPVSRKTEQLLFPWLTRAVQLSEKLQI